MGGAVKFIYQLLEGGLASLLGLSSRSSSNGLTVVFDGDHFEGQGKSVSTRSLRSHCQLQLPQVDLRLLDAIKEPNL